MALIYVDAWGIKRGPHGISRYCRSLIPPLVAAASHHDFVIVRPRRRTADDRLDPSGRAREVELPLPETDWATLAFRPFLERVFRREGRPDLYHSLFHMLPLGLGRGRRAPRHVVVTLHDLISLDYAGQTKRGRIATAWATRFDRAVIPYALRHAGHVICVSEATRLRATEWVPLERSTTVHEGVAPEWFQPAAAPPADRTLASALQQPFVAALGTARPYKNVACIVRAAALVRQTRPELRLVLIGGNGAVDEETRAKVGDHLVITPQVSDAELRAILRDARLFAIASRVEGFGLPLLEAMAIGTPVAASSIPALREVGGDAPFWFDPDSPAELADIILRVLADEALRADTAARGRARAAAFTWARAAAGTIDVYDRVLAGA